MKSEKYDKLLEYLAASIGGIFGAENVKNTHSIDILQIYINMARVARKGTFGIFKKYFIGSPQNCLYLSRKCLYFHEILHRPVKDLINGQTSVKK